MKQQRTRLASAAALALFGASSFAHAATVIPVLNASFESPSTPTYNVTVANWTQVGTPPQFTAVVNNSSTYGGITGSQFADIDGWGAGTAL